METPSNQDVNTGAEASPTPEATRESQTETGSQQTEQPSLRDSVSAMLKEKHGIDLDKTPASEESPIKLVNKTEKGATEEGVEKTPETEKQEKKVEKVEKTEEKEKAPITQPEKKDFTEEELAKLPVRAQARIRELVKEKNDMEGKFKVQYEEPAGRMRNVEQFCQSNGVTAQDFNELLQLMAEIRKNPTEGVKKAEEYLGMLKQQTGLELQPDLAKRVADGALDLETAKEINRLRLVEKGRTADAERAKVDSRQQVQTQLTQATQTWEQQKLASDPDFVKKTAGQPDGVYEMTFRLFKEYFWDGQHPCKTIPDAVALLDQCYQETKSSVLAFQPRPQRRKAPVSSSRSNGSSQEQPEKVDISKPGWARNAVKGVRAKYGIE